MLGAPMEPRSVQSHLGAGVIEEHPLGTLAILPLPDGAEAVEAALQALHPAEQQQARAFSGRRRTEWVGGRTALHRAALARGWELGPVLRGGRGEPLLPEGVAASISHKEGLVAAAIAPAGEGTLGLDVEELGRPRMAIASRILRPEEEEALGALPEAARWPALLRTFALKEAVYKAIHPFVRRYVSFEEAAVEAGGDGEAVIRLHLRRGEGPFHVQARSWRRGAHLWAMVRMRRVERKSPFP